MLLKSMPGIIISEELIFSDNSLFSIFADSSVVCVSGFEISISSFDIILYNSVISADCVFSSSEFNFSSGSFFNSVIIGSFTASLISVCSKYLLLMFSSGMSSCLISSFVLSVCSICKSKSDSSFL